MSKEFTEKAYKAYMKTINENIKNIEIAINYLPKCKEVSKLSFEDWVKWQSGEHKIKEMNNLDKKTIKNEEEFQEFATDVRNRQYQANSIMVDVGAIINNGDSLRFSTTSTYDWDNEYLEIERINNIDVVKLRKYNEQSR
jgi:hypothetical protein